MGLAVVCLSLKCLHPHAPGAAGRELCLKEVQPKCPGLDGIGRNAVEVWPPSAEAGVML